MAFPKAVKPTVKCLSKKLLFPTLFPNKCFKEYWYGSSLHHHFGILVPFTFINLLFLPTQEFQVRNQGATDKWNPHHVILSGSSSLVLLVFFTMALITGHSLDFNVPIIIIHRNSIAIEQSITAQNWKGLSHGDICPWWACKPPKTAEMAQIYCWDPQDFQAGGFFWQSSLFAVFVLVLFSALCNTFVLALFHLTRIDFFSCCFLGCSWEMMQGFCCCFWFFKNLISFPICVWQ